MDLYQELFAYSRNGRYPFHMPGHKRNSYFDGWGFPFSIDITEIEGFDDLHHPDGLILKACERLSELYGSKKSYFCVNGSTGGILSSISATVTNHGRIALARNSHMSAYHAVYLRGLQPYFLLPETDIKYRFHGQIQPFRVEEMLRSHDQIEAVFLTSPTYDGVLSDIGNIAEIVHKYGLPLIVDEAHGAHLKFSEYFPPSSSCLGADLVIQSFHKTLPALTQTAVIHVMSDRVNLPRLERFLNIYQTTSPSYILMASLDRCIRFLEEEGKEAFSNYVKLLEECRKKIACCSCLTLIEPEKAYFYDRSKLLLADQTGRISGFDLARRLRDDFQIEPEMATDDYVLCLSSVGDTQEGFDRLVHAVKKIDRELSFTKADRSLAKESNDERYGGFVHPSSFLQETVQEPSLPESRMRLSDALDGQTQIIPLNDSEACISASYLSLFPPEIPILVPGEVITRKLLDDIRQYQKSGARIHGLIENNSIIVVKNQLLG